MKHGRTAALFGALAVTVGLLAACSSSLSQTDVQDKLQQGLTEQLGGEYTVTCPSDIPVQSGGTFTCDVTSTDGSTAKINVTQNDDQGNLTWEIVASE
jgi:hypothetical protein